MGQYLNPGNGGFQTVLRETYVDKTELIDFINKRIDTEDKLSCFTRPRRFGKTLTVKMLCAYYDKKCNSKELFKNLKISKIDSFEKHLNKYDVIYLDISRFISRSKVTKTNIIADIQIKTIKELKKAFPEYVTDDELYLPDILYDIHQATNSKFIVIIDEWDAIFREEKTNYDLQKNYIHLLRGLFKGGISTDETIAAAYMTGILPIKKYGTESALTDFREYSMVNPKNTAEFIGFSEAETKDLCKKAHMDYESMQNWYDGYSFNNIQHVYNPYSVMLAIKYRDFQNYWTASETYNSLKQYITMDFDGLKDTIIQMLGGERIHIQRSTLINAFQNDMTSFSSKDDILALLIHLGYLAYDLTNEETYIPNLEISDVFKSAVNENYWGEVGKALANSDNLLQATLKGDSDTVARALEMIHESNSSILQYNNETSLSCAITIAYYTAKRYYMTIRELPTGKGFADIVFLPRPGIDKPAIIVELKYDKNADTAIRQIHENRYDGELKKYFGNLLLVGINYNKDAKGENAKKHTCVIEKA